MPRRLLFLAFCISLAFLVALPRGSRSLLAQTPAPQPAGDIPPVLANNPHYQAFQAFYGPRLQGLTSGQSYSPALSEARQQSRALPAIAGKLNTWTSLGPNPITNGQIGNPCTSGCPIGDGPVTGRVQSIAVDPTNANVVFVAAADGGIWKTVDGGSTWTPLTDRLTTATGGLIETAFGALAIDPTNHLIIYAGMGEECFCGDGVGGPGLLKSTDGGNTWSLVAPVSAFPVPGFSFGGMSFARIVVDPTGSSGCSGGLCRLYAATSLGLFQSTNGGANWTLVAGGADSTQGSGTTCCAAAFDVVIDPSITVAKVYTSIGNIFGLGTMGGVYFSTNGTTFVQYLQTTNGIPNGNPGGGVYVGRTSLAIDLNNSSPAFRTVYAAVGHGLSDPSSSVPSDQFLGVYKTSDGLTWSLAANPTSNCQLGSTSGPCSNYQAWYANVIAVDPTNSQVLFGATDVYGSTNGGQSWTDVSQITTGPTNGLHVDQHVLTFAGGTVWSGNDGGVWSSTNDGASWTNHNGGGLVTNQFYQGGSIAPYDPTILLGGLQDNGTVYTRGVTSVASEPAAWLARLGGDGVSTAIDPRTPASGTSGHWYGEFPRFGALFRADNPTSAGTTFTDISTSLNKTGAGFLSPFVLDPNHPDRLYAGSQVVSVITNPVTATNSAGGESWSVISQQLTTTASISVIAIDPSDPTGNTIYAGTTNGHVFMTTSGTTAATWTQITGNLSALNGRKITSITTNHKSPSTVFVTSSGFGTLHVAKLTSPSVSNTTWTDVSTGLPNVPASVSLTLNGSLYAGTDVGIFVSNDGGTTWASLSGILPFVQVQDLLFQPAFQPPTGSTIPASPASIIALTHGRGAWSFGLPAPAVSSVSPSSGPAAGGTVVTISGSSFSTEAGKTAVNFVPTGGSASSSNAATNVSCSSNTTCTATSPAGTAGTTVDVIVTSAFGVSVPASADQFAYQTNAPIVTAISPTSGLPAGGTVVTITGANFTGTTAVKFGTTAATTFVVNSSTQISATSPAGTLGTKVDVTVTTTFGTSATSSADQFTYANLKLGDVNGDGSVTSVDALCVLRIVVGLPGTVACPIPPPGNPIIALNETGATIPTSVDALCILRGVVGLPATSVCPLITAPTAEPGAITSATANRRGSASGEVGLSAETTHGSQRTTVQVQAKALSGSLGAWTVDVSYDPKAVKILACAPANGSVCNTSFADGTLRIAGASASGLTGDPTLASISVEPIGSTGRSSALQVRAQTLTDPDGNALTANGSTGTVQVGTGAERP